MDGRSGKVTFFDGCMRRKKEMETESGEEVDSFVYGKVPVATRKASEGQTVDMFWLL